MIELMEKMDILKNALNENSLLKDLEKIQIEILNDSRLYEQIKRKDSSINQNPKIMEYRRLENEVNFLILAMNQYLKNSLLDDEVCYESD